MYSIYVPSSVETITSELVRRMRYINHWKIKKTLIKKHVMFREYLEKFQKFNRLSWLVSKKLCQRNARSDIVVLDYSRDLEFRFHENQLAFIENSRRYITILFLRLYYHYHFMNENRMLTRNYRNYNIFEFLYSIIKYIQNINSYLKLLVTYFFITDICHTLHKIIKDAVCT